MHGGDGLHCTPSLHVCQLLNPTARLRADDGDLTGIRRTLFLFLLGSRLLGGRLPRLGPTLASQEYSTAHYPWLPSISYCTVGRWMPKGFLEKVLGYRKRHACTE